jgi:hypothetical protein
MASFWMIGELLLALAGLRSGSKVVDLVCLAFIRKAVGDEELRGLLAETAMNGTGVRP